MNLKKLQSGFANTSSDALESFIQSARVNEELALMNEEITFDKMKKFLDETFKDNSDYKIFSKSEEIQNFEGLVIPQDDKSDWWNKDAYCYFEPKKQAYFYIIPATKEESEYFNVKLRVVSQNTLIYKENITFASQMTDIKDKIEFHINSISYLHDIVDKIAFEDLELNFQWFEYTNMQNLTDECIHKDVCKEKKCKQDKCPKYHALIKYTENMYNANNLFNSFIASICKEKHVRLTEIFFDTKKNGICYNFGKSNIFVSLPKRNDYEKSSAKITISTDGKAIASYKAKEGKNGYELIEIFNKMFMDYVTEKVNILV